MVQHLAVLPGRADALVVTGVLTASLVAGLIGWTVGVLSAFHLTVGTCQGSVLVDHQTVLALTLGLVVGDDALLVEITRLTGAGIQTLSSRRYASCTVGTISIVLTIFPLRYLRSGGDIVAFIRWPTSYMGTTNKALRALTPRFVQNNRAEGVLPT